MNIDYTAIDQLWIMIVIMLVGLLTKWYQLLIECKKEVERAK
jgi:hypothetical protein